MSKRDYLTHLKSNCISIGQGRSLIPVFIERVQPPKDKSNMKSPYLLFCRALVKKPTLVRFEVKKDDDNKKQKTEQSQDEVPEGVTIDVNQEMMVSCFDKVSCSKLSEADVVEIACNASMYMKNDQIRYGFKSDRVTFRKEICSLQKSVYEKTISSTTIAQIPTPLNMRPSDFPGVEDEKYMIRKFVAPLSNDQTVFESVIPVVENDERNMVCIVKENDVAKEYVGFSMTDGSSSNNSIGIVYNQQPTLDEPNPKPIMLKLSYKPSFWTYLGIDDPALWKPVAKRIFSNLREAYFFAYSSVANINSLNGNSNVFYDEDGNIENDGGEKEETEIIATTAFGTRLKVNMFETVKACGLKIDADYVEQIMEDRKYDREYNPYGSDETSRPKHPLNDGFRTKLENGVKSVFNVSEIPSDFIPNFFKSAKAVKGGSLTYYGVFEKDEPYEQDDENITEYITEHNIVPNIVFAILE